MKSKNNKKGFTLIELLSVIVVLIVIFLIALTAIRGLTKKAKRNSIKANGTSYIKAIDTFLISAKTDDTFYAYGSFNVGDIDVKVDGTKPDNGYFNLYNFQTKYACLDFGKYKYVMTRENNNDNVTISLGNCGTIEEDYPIAASDIHEYSFTGNTKWFSADSDGMYKIQVWGAQGGTSGNFTGGYGGYAVGYIYLDKYETIYISVGEKGVQSGTASPYNGGGRGTNNNGSSGGGATSVSFQYDTIKNSDIEDLIIVAGGGGGAIEWERNWTSGNGGHGGGYIGGDGTTTGWAKAPGLGGTQTAGGAPGKNVDNNDSATAGSFGQGGIYFQSTSQSPGGGGGLYGGGGAYFCGAGGGSGYIGNDDLMSKFMVCYDCQTSDEEDIRTISTTCVSEDPKPNCAKKGDGYAIITKIG